MNGQQADPNHQVPTKRGEGAVLERGATEVVLLGRQVKSQMES